MGKLRFTLTYILFWFIIVFSCLLAENFALLSTDHMGGMSNDSLILLSLFVIFALVFYYFLERKKNNITFDKVLLPIIGIFGLVSIATICWQQPRVFDNPYHFLVETISFTPAEKLNYSLQVVVWCAVLYGVIFLNNRFAIARKLYKWLPFVYVCGILACSVVDIFLEFNTIVAIFKNSSESANAGLQFIIYNSNVWGMLLLFGLLCCVVLSVRKFNIFYYISMVFIFIMIVFTSCSTATFIGLGVLVLYSLYEIFTLFNKQRKKSVILLTAYVSFLTVFSLLISILVLSEVPFALSFWRFIKEGILFKDYGTLTSRKGIWASVFHIVTRDPVDLIFGLGYKTGNVIFAKYFQVYENYDFPVRSAHDGLFEIFLRHGIFGLVLYVAAFVPFLIGLIKLVKKKQYRVAYIYTLCVLGLLGHSITESTLFFTPNIGGMFTTIVFYLPVANEVKDKYLFEIKEDLLQTEKQEARVSYSETLYYVSLLIIGSIVALASTLTIGYIYKETATLIAYIIGIVVFVLALFIIPLITALIKKKSIKETYGELLLEPIKNHWIAIVTTIGVSVLFGFILPLIFKYDLFSCLLFTLFAFVFYNFALLFFDRNNKCSFLSFIDIQFTNFVRHDSCEVQNE